MISSIYFKFYYPYIYTFITFVLRFLIWLDDQYDHIDLYVHIVYQLNNSLIKKNKKSNNNETFEKNLLITVAHSIKILIIKKVKYIIWTNLSIIT